MWQPVLVSFQPWLLKPQELQRTSECRWPSESPTEFSTSRRTSWTPSMTSESFRRMVRFSTRAGKPCQIRTRGRKSVSLKSLSSPSLFKFHLQPSWEYILMPPGTNNLNVPFMPEPNISFLHFFTVCSECVDLDLNRNASAFAAVLSQLYPLIAERGRYGWDQNWISHTYQKYSLTNCFRQKIASSSWLALFLLRTFGMFHAHFSFDC